MSGLDAEQPAELVAPIAELLAEPWEKQTGRPRDLTLHEAVITARPLAPCWSWRSTPELWFGKHKTTGHNAQVVVLLDGDVVYVSDPVTGT